MKLLTTLFILSTLLMTTTVTAQHLKTADDSLAYSLGVLIATNLRQQGFSDLNADLISAGLKTALKGEQTLIALDQCNNFVQESATNRQMKQHESNKVAGEQYLAANSKRDGVVTLKDGLQYEVITMGNGPKPKATDKVNVHYHGTLIDGTIFDSSVDRGEPISFGLNQVIKGWTEALQLMPVGSKWKVFIPYQLGYGEQAAGGAIKPYSTLIFEIELLGIDK